MRLNEAFVSHLVDHVTTKTVVSQVSDSGCSPFWFVEVFVKGEVEDALL